MLVSTLIALGCVQPDSGPELLALAPELACASSPLLVQAAGVAPVVIDPLAEQPTLRWPELLVSNGQELLLLPEPEWVEDEATLDLPPLDAGSWQLLLRDPFGHESALPFGITGRPVLAGLEPASLCQELGSQTVRLTGLFAVAEGALPTVRIGGREQEVLIAEDCDTASPMALCASLLVQVDAGTLSLGLEEIQVEGPVEDCVSEEPLRVQVVPAPRILDIEDREVCDGGGVLSVVGEGFDPEMSAWVDGVEAELTYVDAGRVEVAIPAMAVGSYSLELEHPNGCTAWDEEGVRVAAAPLMFFVNPPQLWGGLDLQQVTAYIADVTDDITDVWVEDSSGGTHAVDWSWDPEDPGRLLATVPAASLGAGDYRLAFSQGGDCAGETSGQFEIRGGTSLQLLSVEPEQAWTFDRTPIQIGAQGGLEATPRVYMVNATTGESASLLGVHLLDEDTLSATVPDGLSLGDWHLLVYNPDQGMGRLLRAIEVTSDPPPSIESVRPATLPRGGSEDFQVVGRNFRDATVTLVCADGSSLTPTVLSETSARLNLRANTNSLSPTICLVRLSNADGSQTQFASISVTNPSQNLFPWSEGPELNEARRAPAAGAVRANALNRYVVVMGGDEGDYSTARRTIEVAPIGVYSDLGDFELLPGELPGARTLAQAVVIGPFLYLVGGRNTVQSVATTHRARILDPLDVPLFETLSLRTGQGLKAGTWTYRVAALYPSDDPSNPGGESLPSDPFTLVLPESTAGIQPTLRWTAMDGASGYRIYRSPQVDAPNGEERWLTDVSVEEFTDTGGATSGSVSPLPVGSLGNWAQVDSLKQARAGACVTTVPDPNPDPEIVWILAAGGMDSDGNPLDSIEAMEVRIEGPRTQVTGGWTKLSETLTEAAWACGAWSLDYRWHSVVEPGDSWYYVGGGHGAQGISSTVDAWKIGGSELLSEHTTVDSMSPPRAGFGAGAGSNFLYALGGQQGQPSDRGTSAKIETPPDFKNWNSLAQSLVVERYLPAIAQQSALFVLIGGETDSAGATTRTEVTNF